MTVDTFALKDRFIKTDRIGTTVTGSVPAATNENTTITAEAGEIWTIRGVAAKIPADADATSGASDLQFRIPNSGTIARLWKINFSSNEDLEKRVESLVSGTYDGSFNHTQVLNLEDGLKITDTDGVEFSYTNNTDVTMENNREYVLLVERYEA
jgi:hypothetical protein